MPEAILCGGEALGEEGIVRAGGANVGDAPAVPHHFHGLNEARGVNRGCEIGQGGLQVRFGHGHDGSLRKRATINGRIVHDLVGSDGRRREIGAGVSDSAAGNRATHHRSTVGAGRRDRRRAARAVRPRRLRRSLPGAHLSSGASPGGRWLRLALHRRAGAWPASGRPRWTRRLWRRNASRRFRRRHGGGLARGTRCGQGKARSSGNPLLRAVDGLHLWRAAPCHVAGSDGGGAGPRRHDGCGGAACGAPDHRCRTDSLPAAVPHAARGRAVPARWLPCVVRCLRERRQASARQPGPASRSAGRGDRLRLSNARAGPVGRAVTLAGTLIPWEGAYVAWEQIIAETHDRVGVIRLNRPERLNAWTDTMSGEIVEQITAWNEDDGIGAILVTGEGRAFCAGADIGVFAQRAETNKKGAGEPLRRGGASFTHFIRESKPTVAAINGYAVGVGLTMILPFDVRIASTEARLSIRFIKMGLMPELGSTRLLAQLIGLGPATDMCLTGRMVPGEEAHRLGLVTEVVQPDALFDTALAKANEIANNSTPAVMMIKELLNRNPMDADLEAVMEREGIRDQIARRLPDHSEAVTAFMEKREARFNRAGE
ncbi:MAG: hypothetical protein F4Y86_05770 [Gammaproteobacteria bacterium]|nr:hypothetical protein [Gammaproteobacteria bacterium]MYB36206.1 hypothetical protein [Gammaproteobacteria bacterium]